jgi:hypothetical protein
MSPIPQIDAANAPGKYVDYNFLNEFLDFEQLCNNLQKKIGAKLGFDFQAKKYLFTRLAVAFVAGEYASFEQMCLNWPSNFGLQRFVGQSVYAKTFLLSNVETKEMIDFLGHLEQEAFQLGKSSVNGLGYIQMLISNASWSSSGHHRRDLQTANSYKEDSFIEPYLSDEMIANIF